MHLSEYIKNMKKAELEEFARRCDTAYGQLRQVARGIRSCGEYLAINIDRESGGSVSCEEMRPDIDWAYLRASKSKKTKKEAA